MKRFLLTALTTALLASTALAEPAFTVDDRTMTVTGAEIVSVDGPGASLVSGGYDIPAFANPTAVALNGDSTVWSLAVGEHTVTAASLGTAGDGVVFTVVIEPPDFVIPSRIDQVRIAFFSLLGAVQVFTDLATTQSELFQAVILGPVPADDAGQ